MTGPKVTTSFRVYRPARPEPEHLMSYPHNHTLVHFGSPAGTTYTKEEAE